MSAFWRSQGCCFARALVVIAFVNQVVSGDDWPQWMGPARDSIYRETGVLETIPTTGLTVKWRTPLGGGYAGPAVVGERLFVADYVSASADFSNDPSNRTSRQGKERIQCLNAVTGAVVWSHEYDRPYSISYAYGPRATPTVSGGKVYFLGAEGNLLCLDAASGKLLWQHDLQAEYKAPPPIWGFCGHPLIDGQKLICLVGGKGSTAVAFDKDTGRELWKALDSKPDAGYAPPTLITAGGKRQLLIWTPETLNGLDPETGNSYWSQPLAPQYGMSIVAPRKSGDFLYASAIGDVGALYKLDTTKPAAELEWKGDNRSAVYCANSTPFLENGLIFGCDCRSGHLRGVDLSSGDRLWETTEPTTGKRRGGHGTAFLVKHEPAGAKSERFFLFSETGDLITALLNREGYHETGRFHVLEPTGESFGRPVVWSHPAFASRCCFARNDKEIVCVSLAP
jgi:outer membrane protein assembly factor BamB